MPWSYHEWCYLSTQLMPRLLWWAVVLMGLVIVLTDVLARGHSYWPQCLYIFSVAGTHGVTSCHTPFCGTSTHFEFQNCLQCRHLQWLHYQPWILELPGWSPDAHEMTLCRVPSPFGPWVIVTLWLRSWRSQWDYTWQCLWCPDWVEAFCMPGIDPTQVDFSLTFNFGRRMVNTA